MRAACLYAFVAMSAGCNIAVPSSFQETRLIDCRYGVEFPTEFDSLPFASASFEDERYYEVRYHTRADERVYIRMVPADRAYPIYESKRLSGRTAEVSELGLEDITRRELWWLKDEGFQPFDLGLTGRKDMLVITGRHDYETMVMRNDNSNSHPADTWVELTEYVCVVSVRLEKYVLIFDREYASEESMKSHSQDFVDLVARQFAGS